MNEENNNNHSMEAASAGVNMNSYHQAMAHNATNFTPEQGMQAVMQSGLFKWGGR